MQQSDEARDTQARKPEQPTAGTTARLRFVAPTEIAPGQSVQLVANATAVNGSVEDVSRRADWKVFWATGTSVLVLTETGVLTAGDLGYGTVEVKFEGKSAIAVIIVVSKGYLPPLGNNQRKRCRAPRCHGDHPVWNR